MAWEVGLFECGLPNTLAERSVVVLLELALRIQPAAGVVQVYLARPVKPRVLAVAQLVERRRPLRKPERPAGTG